MTLTTDTQTDPFTPPPAGTRPQAGQHPGGDTRPQAGEDPGSGTGAHGGGSGNERPTTTPPTRMTSVPGVELTGPDVPGLEQVLTPQALQTVARMHRTFEAARREVLALRPQRAARIAAGELLLEETAAVREGQWQVAPAGPGLRCRTVEITGPVTRSMAINALNSGADVWMADLEDATSPTWENIIDSHHNLIRLVRGDLDFTTADGREYRVGPVTPTVMMRPRGWHLPERNLRIDGQVPSAALVDAALYFHHCAQAMIDRGQGPYYYLPKLESHREARLWNDVFCALQEDYGIRRGTVRATVLIETLPAALEMEEILYELREHSAGLNAGRWDYIFSIIKTLHPWGADAVLPNREDITMTTPFMRAYCERLVATCHRRGAYAIGGMSAFVPADYPHPSGLTALQRVRADKARDAEDGFDGAWVAHPRLVDTARDAFGPALRGRDHQLERQREDYLDPAELLDLRANGEGVTCQGLRSNVAVALRYLTAWLQGRGAVAIDHLMEDAATVEIARTQVWQWVRQGVRLEDGLTVTPELVDRIIATEATAIARDLQADPGPGGAEGPDAAGAGDVTHLDAAVSLFREVALGAELEPFFTLRAYAYYLPG